MSHERRGKDGDKSEEEVLTVYGLMIIIVEEIGPQYRQTRINCPTFKANRIVTSKRLLSLVLLT